MAREKVYVVIRGDKFEARADIVGIFVDNNAAATQIRREKENERENSSTVYHIETHQVRVVPTLSRETQARLDSAITALKDLAQRDPEIAQHLDTTANMITRKLST